MTALALDVRELSFDEIDDVGGGPVFLPIVVGAIHLANAVYRTYQVAKAVGVVVGAGAAGVAAYETIEARDD